MEAIVNEVTVGAGEYNLTQGHKRGEKNHVNKDGSVTVPKGNGYALEFMRPYAVVDFTTEAGDGSIDVAKYFYYGSWKKLTAKRLCAIKATAPATINVTLHERDFGNSYYSIDEDSMNEWLNSAELKCKSMKGAEAYVS